MHLFVISFTALWYFSCVLDGSPKLSESLFSCLGVGGKVCLSHPQTVFYISSVQKSSSLIFYLYTVSLSFITIFLKNSLASQPTCCLFILHEKVGSRRALFLLEGRVWDAVRAPNFCQTFYKLRFYFISRCFGVTSILLCALHHLNSF